MSAEKFVYGFGLVDENLFCEFVNEQLGHYLGIASKRCLTEIVHPDELNIFRETIDPVIARKSDSGMVFLRLMTSEAGYRECRLNITRQADGDCRIEVIDVDNSLDSYVDFREATRRTAFLLEKIGTLIFEYDYAQDSIELYKYDRTEKIILNKDDEYATLVERMIDDFRHPVDGAVTFDFDKTYEINGKYYSVKGNDLVKGGSKYILIGTVDLVKGAESTKNSEAEHFDAMTGLYNKPYSLSMAKEAMKQHEKVSIIMLDIDDFKTINDSFGHIFGDEAIKKLAVILRDVTMDRGFVGRFGGDEFFMCLYDIDTEQDLRAVLQSVFYHFKRAFSEVNHTFSVTMGIAEYPRNGEDFDLLLKKADRALYIGKFKGKNRYIIYKEHIHGELNEDDGDGKVISEAENSNRAAQITFVRNSTAELAYALKHKSKAKTVLDGICGKLLGSYKFEGVNVYAGDGFKNVYSFGRLSKPMQNTAYLNLPEVVSQFNENGIFHTAVKYVRNKYVEQFHGYIGKHGIINSLQILVGTKDNIRALVTFDNENELGSCSADETRDIMILSQMIAELLLKD